MKLATRISKLAKLASLLNNSNLKDTKAVWFLPHYYFNTPTLLVFHTQLERLVAICYTFSVFPIFSIAMCL